VTGQFIAPLGMGVPLQITSDQPYATRVELDISTPPDRTVPIPQDVRGKLFHEMSDSAKEILEKGDIP
jgi:hypothetical protein